MAKAGNQFTLFHEMKGSRPDKFQS